MRSSAFALSIVVVFFAAALTLSCGSSSPTTPNTVPSPGIPQSVVISPATADAKNYPDGQVQFTATGYYQTPPSPVGPLQASWSVCDENTFTPTDEASINVNGVAQCSAGAMGTFTVYGSVPTNCTSIGPCGRGCFVSGSAALRCP